VSVEIPEKLRERAVAAYQEASIAFGAFVPPDGEREYTLARVDHAAERHWHSLDAAVAAILEDRVEAVARALCEAWDTPMGPCPDCKRKGREALGLAPCSPDGKDDGDAG
jgi:hypothetical protein